MSTSIMLLRTRYEHWSAYASMNGLVAAIDADEFAVTERLVSNGDADFPLQWKPLRHALRRVLRTGGCEHYHLSDLIAEGSVLRRAMQQRMDIVHFVDGEHTARFTPRLLRHAHDVRTMATFHQPPDILPSVTSRRALEALDMIVAVAPHQAAWFQEIVGEERVRTILLCTDTAFFHPRPRPRDAAFRCITCGHWLRDWPAIQRIATALAHDAGIELHLVTDRETGLEGMSNVVRHRNVDDDTLRQLYQSADLLLLPLVDGTANNTLLEGLACGLPVVGWDIPAMRAYLAGDEGLLAPIGDVDALVDGIRQLRQDDHRRQHMSARARARAELLSCSRMAREYEEIYRYLKPHRAGNQYFTPARVRLR
jgi:hypothetical protein